MKASAVAIWDRLDQTWYGNADNLKLAVRRWLKTEGAKLQFRSKPLHPSTFWVAFLLSREDSDLDPHAGGKRWCDGLQSALTKDARCKKSELLSNDFEGTILLPYCLSEPRDELKVVVIRSNDPHLRAFLSLLGPLSSLMAIHCVIVGAVPAGLPAPPADWCMLLPDPTDPKPLMRMVDQRLAAPTGQ